VQAPTKTINPAHLGVATPLFDPSNNALGAFYKALGQTSKKKRSTRVVFFGASHVAADLFTRSLRHRLQSLYGDAGPGFVVPGPPWKSYNHRDLRLSYSKDWASFRVRRYSRRADGLYGLAGVTFSSANPRSFARIKTARKGRFGRKVSRIEIYYWAHPKGGGVHVYIDNKLKGHIPTKSKRLGPGYRTYNVADGPHSIELRPDGTGEVILFGVSLDRKGPGVVMDSLGVSGTQAGDQLAWNSGIFTAHLKRRNPDLVVLAYGTNESGEDLDPIAEYEIRLMRVVNRVKTAVPTASCLLVGPSDWPLPVDKHGPRLKKAVPQNQLDSYRRFWRKRRKMKVKGYLPRKRQDKIIATQKRVARRLGCAFWDWRAAMGGPLSMLNWSHSTPPLAKRDYVHHTRAGYEKIFTLFWDALMPQP